MIKIRFSDIESRVDTRPGIYQIHTNAGKPLKVGISGDLQKRLKGHRASKQSGLRLKSGGTWNNPSDVDSKSSILAKHLYFDGSITVDHDLRTEIGRRRFLSQECYIFFEHTPTREVAREMEIAVEHSGKFRYLKVIRHL